MAGKISILHAQNRLHIKSFKVNFIELSNKKLRSFAVMLIYVYLDSNWVAGKTSMILLSQCDIQNITFSTGEMFHHHISKQYH